MSKRHPLVTPAAFVESISAGRRHKRRRRRGRRRRGALADLGSVVGHLTEDLRHRVPSRRRRRRLARTARDRVERISTIAGSVGTVLSAAAAGAELLAAVRGQEPGEGAAGGGGPVDAEHRGETMVAEEKPATATSTATVTWDADEDPTAAFGDHHTAVTDDEDEDQYDDEDQDQYEDEDGPATDDEHPTGETAEVLEDGR